ncbi:MAG: hypothetical protein LBI19_02910 [Oscillospiraceae bacterium]|nr:hypothetical protein [Oscillospiraceae bacterium]
MTFYKVISRFFDNGRFTVKMQTYRDCLDRRPNNQSFEVPDSDIYHDWFDTLEEAQAFMKEAKEA